MRFRPKQCPSPSFSLFHFPHLFALRCEVFSLEVEGNWVCLFFRVLDRASISPEHVTGTDTNGRCTLRHISSHPTISRSVFLSRLGVATPPTPRTESVSSHSFSSPPFSPLTPPPLAKGYFLIGTPPCDVSAQKNVVVHVFKIKNKIKFNQIQCVPVLNTCY